LSPTCFLVWARKVTSSCYQALPLIEIAFNDLYENKHFVLNGKIYKCHPDLGEDIVSEEEMVDTGGWRLQAVSISNILARQYRPVSSFSGCP
jgi:hypothetical protein